MIITAQLIWLRIHQKYKNVYLARKAAALILIIIIPLFVLSCGLWPQGVGVFDADAQTYEQSLEASSSPTLPSFEPDHIKKADTPVIPIEKPDPELGLEPGTESDAELIQAWPVWMYIPALGVDAEILDTGTDFEADTMEIAPSGTVISWWRESSIPGNEGNAIFGGHNRWGGVLGQLFALDTLQIGDALEIVYADGTSLEFRLESVFVYPLATAPADIIMDVRGEPRVTVITCKEPYNPAIGTSDNRIIAIFKLESDFVIPDPPIEPFPLRQ